MSNKKTVQMSTTQPADWVEKFKRRASLEGMTFSEWVGQACLKAMPCSDEANWSQSKAIEELSLSPRPGRGAPVTKGATADAS